MSLSRWGGLRNRPYDPNATDADNDGIVQEGTLWERPVGTRVVTSEGTEAPSNNQGSTLTDVERFRIVDRRGRPVSYSPSWRGQLIPLSDRLGSLGDRTPRISVSMGTVGEPRRG